MKNHSLITTLKSLTGNPRGCVYTEPLWGIPFNLYAPYVSIYMVALGLSDRQIGLIVSISWSFQIVLALLSGVVTDKLGRRRTTLIFDILAWSVPALISAFAQNFWYFLAAGVINGVWQITRNSWTCLLVEDADQSQLVDIYTWIHIANQLVGFVAPLAGLLISIFTLAPTVRGLYVFAAIMFTLKAVVTYLMTQETRQGKVRMHETRHQSIMSVLREYGSVLQDLLRTPQTLYTAGIMLIISISNVITGSFWGIIVTEKLHIPAQNLALFPFVKSAVMLFFFFMVMPRFNKMHFKLPLVIGFLGFIVSQLLLITAPDRGYLFLIMSVFLEACCFATIYPLMDQMVVLTIDPKERARIQSILYVGIILITSPFGWIAGNLSGLDKSLPFILNIALFGIGAALAYLAGNAAQKRLAVSTTTP
ncbi:MAG: MFS transporter [Anaerolineales bacterium]